MAEIDQPCIDKTYGGDSDCTGRLDKRREECPGADPQKGRPCRSFQNIPQRGTCGISQAIGHHPHSEKKKAYTAKKAAKHTYCHYVMSSCPP
jgi:hypothetical protein